MVKRPKTPRSDDAAKTATEGDAVATPPDAPPGTVEVEGPSDAPFVMNEKPDPPATDPDATASESVAPSDTIEPETDTTQDAPEVGELPPPHDPPHDPPHEPPAEPAPASTLPQPVQVRRGPGFVPLVLGGLVAGAIGYGVASLVPAAPPAADEDLSARIEEAETGLASLNQRVDTLPEPVINDLSDIDARLGEMEARLAEAAGSGDTAALDGRLTTIEEALGGLENRLAVLEETVTEGMGPDALEDAAEDELADFRAELNQLAADAEARVEEANARASQIEADAADAAAQADRQALLSELRTAVEGGAAFADPLSRLDAPPESLASAAEAGVATLTELQQGFAEAARDALAAVQTVPQDASAGDRLVAFLKRQTNARSLSPQQGDDPDAVLSRAEAALNEGRLDDTLTVLEGLPPDALDAMSGWLAQARTRAGALAALDDLSATTN